MGIVGGGEEEMATSPGLGLLLLKEARLSGSGWGLVLGGSEG